MRLTFIIETLVNRKVWNIGWSIFAAALAFQAALFFARPDISAYHDQVSLNISKVGSDIARVLSICDHLRDSMGAATECMNYYKRLFPRNVKRVTLNLADIYAGIESVRKSRSDIALAVSFVRGGSFHNKDLEAFRLGFELDLLNIDKQLSMIEDVYLTTAAVDSLGAIKKSADWQATAYEIETDVAEALARFNSFSEVAQAMIAESSIETHQATQHLQVLGVKAWLAIVGLCYQILFIVFAIAAWKRLSARSVGSA